MSRDINFASWIHPAAQSDIGKQQWINGIHCVCEVSFQDKINFIDKKQANVVSTILKLHKPPDNTYSDYVNKSARQNVNICSNN